MLAHLELRVAVVGGGARAAGRRAGRRADRRDVRLALVHDAPHEDLGAVIRAERRLQRLPPCELALLAHRCNNIKTSLRSAKYD